MERMNEERKVELVKAAACRAFEVPLEALEYRRDRRPVDARRAAISFMRKDLDMTFMGIGAALGKHHATIIHHERVHQELVENDPGYRQCYREMVTELAARGLATASLN